LSAAAAASEDFGGLLAREAQLRHCLVLLDGIDEALGEGERDRVRAGTIESLLHALSGCDVITSGTMPPAELRHRLHARPLGFELTYPGQGERLEIWRRRLPSDVAAELAADIPVLASKFRFTPGQIARAVDLSLMTAPRRADDRICLTSADLHARCRDTAEHGLHLLCQKNFPHYGWSGIVLPAHTQAHIPENSR